MFKYLGGTRGHSMTTLKSLINEQGGLVLRIALKQACSFIRDFRVSRFENMTTDVPTYVHVNPNFALQNFWNLQNNNMSYLDLNP